MNLSFDTYARWIDHAAVVRAAVSKAENDSDAVYRSPFGPGARTLRGLLPARRSRASGYGWSGLQSLLLRSGRIVAGGARRRRRMLRNCRVIPAFLLGSISRSAAAAGVHTWRTRRRTQQVAARLTTDPARGIAEVPSGLRSGRRGQGVAAALYPVTEASDVELLGMHDGWSRRACQCFACLGDRGNRRHKPGRAFERTIYRFDVLTDYGAFRDLQRHRLLTLDWQLLSTRHGYVEPEAAVEAGADTEWRRVMDRSAGLYELLRAEGLTHVAQYAVAMAYRVRFVMDMNAREAMHVIELRTSPQGHPAYRRVCQHMHRLIAEAAGHRAIAGAMQFVDHSTVELERLQAERRLEQKRERT